MQRFAIDGQSFRARLANRLGLRPGDMLTAEMLDSMRAAVPVSRRIPRVVNTHNNGDHVFGNQLVADSEIIAWLGQQQDAMIAMLQEMVDIDSGSYNKAGADAVGDVVRRFMASQVVTRPPRLLR